MSFECDILVSRRYQGNQDNDEDRMNRWVMQVDEILHS